MTLVTRCPACGTAFRVHSTQLAQKSGRVRCGKCATVFDGVAALNEPSAERPATEIEPSPQLALFELAEAVERKGMAEPAASPGSASEPEFLREAPAPRGRAAWAVGALAASFALALQAALLYRTELVVLFPETREPLAGACRLLGCALRLPRRPDLMSIETSDLESDRRREGVIVLNAVIHNRAPFMQEYPALELTLTDERDQAVVRRVLDPRDYLRGSPSASLAQGLAAGAETTLRLHFQAGGARAVGYRLYLFYP
jgi:predicted Zn finger-like uncharacterized protein